MALFRKLNNSLPKPAIGVYSFGGGNKNDSKPSAQFEFDVTTFRDPSGQKQFKAANGTWPDVRTWVSEDKRVSAVIGHCLTLASDLGTAKPNLSEVPSSWVSFSFRDHHGVWIAPAIAELVGNALSEAGFTVALIHHNLEHKEVFGLRTGAEAR